MTTTRDGQINNNTPALHIAFELGVSRWQLAFTIGMGQSARLRSVAALIERRFCADYQGQAAVWFIGQRAGAELL